MTKETGTFLAAAVAALVSLVVALMTMLALRRFMASMFSP